jgi:hypothetical protein
MGAATGTKFRYKVAAESVDWAGVGARFWLNGAAQESNLPSRGLHDLTGFEDRLGHRARAAPE